MIKGKILNLKWTSKGWVVKLGKFEKVCQTTEDLNNYLIKLLKNARDKKKLALLKEDLKKWFSNK